MKQLQVMIYLISIILFFTIGRFVWEKFTTDIFNYTFYNSTCGRANTMAILNKNY